jgi:hypothetical protein
MTEMARHVRTRIRYDGPVLAGHEMDVQDLAPALLAVSNIVQIANRKFNGDTASIRVLVDADVEQQCFQLDLSLVQSLLDQAAVLVGAKEVVTAKEIAEWVGLIGTGGFGLFQVLKRIYGQTDNSRPGVTFTAGDQTGTTIINIAGDVQGVIVPTPTAQLLVDPEVNRNVKAVLHPLQKEGYQELSFLHGDQQVAHINKEEAERIIADAPLDLSSAPTESISHIRGSVRIKSPQYEGGAKWALLWQGRAIDAEMKDDAAQWVNEFQHNRVSAPPNTTLEVTMTETVKLDVNGLAVGKPTYVVHEVHSVEPPPVQAALPF